MYLDAPSLRFLDRQVLGIRMLSCDCHAHRFASHHRAHRMLSDCHVNRTHWPSPRQFCEGSNESHSLLKGASHLPEHSDNTVDILSVIWIYQFFHMWPLRHISAPVLAVPTESFEGYNYFIVRLRGRLTWGVWPCPWVDI